MLHAKSLYTLLHRHCEATGFVASAKLIAAPSTPPLPDSIQPEDR